MDISFYHYNLTKDKAKAFYIRFPLLIGSSWLFQGILYMDKTEKYFKISLDILFFLFFFTIFTLLSISYSFIFALIIGHSMNWIFNSHIYVLLKNLNLTKTKKDDFVTYMDNLKDKSKEESSIEAVFAFGSISRNELKENSDLDVRIIRKKGFVNGIFACFFAFKERRDSFFRKFPLDIYVLDDPSVIQKHINNEKPIVIYDPKRIHLSLKT